MSDPGFRQGDELDFHDVDVVIDFPCAATEASVQRSVSSFPLSQVSRSNLGQRETLISLSTHCAVLEASNFSVGVHVLSHLVHRASQLLDPVITSRSLNHTISTKRSAERHCVVSRAVQHLGRRAAWSDVYVDRGDSKIRHDPKSWGYRIPRWKRNW